MAMSFANFQDVPIAATDAPLFEKKKHIQYWLRCFRSPLPTQYQANDSQLLALTYFTVSALDLLGVLFTSTTNDERLACINSIYQCEHPDGGFRGSLGTSLGAKRNNVNAVWDLANLGASYFALCSLVVLGDDLSRVNKAGCLRQIKKLQRQNGSFGEYLGYDGSIMGGMDTRYGYFAMAIRWILREYKTGPVYGVDDVDLEAYTECIHCSQTYDGGISEEPFHEAHAGFAYCALASLAFIGYLPRDLPASGNRNILNSPSQTIEWLLDCLTTTIEEDDEDFSDTYSADAGEVPEAALHAHAPPLQGLGAHHAIGPGFQKLRSIPASQLHAHEQATASPQHPELPTHSAYIHWSGFSGRHHKVADTCYAFWAGASLKLLDGLDLLDPQPLRRYLLGKTQHMIAGGFGKFPDDPPDIYHSYLGLAALAMMGVGRGNEAVLGPHMEDLDVETIRDDLGDAVADKLDGDDDNLRKLDTALCISRRARLWLERQEWRRALISS